MYGFADTRYLQIETAVPPQFNSRQTTDFIKRTKTAVFGLYQNGTSTRQSVYAVTQGNYPAFSYNVGLALSSKWKTATINGKKWHTQDAAALSVKKTEASVRLGDIPTSLSDPASSYEDLRALLDTASQANESPVVFALFIPASETPGLISSLGIPLNITLGSVSMTVTGTQAADSYQATLRVNTKSPSEAKALTAIFSLLRATIGRRAPSSGITDPFITSLLFANPPALDGNTVIITGPLSRKTLLDAITLKLVL
jgi:hypothetical protein